jgi:hypothetical protein
MMTPAETAPLEMEAAYARAQVNHWRAVEREIAAKFREETMEQEFDRAAKDNRKTK